MEEKIINNAQETQATETQATETQEQEQNVDSTIWDTKLDDDSTSDSTSDTDTTDDGESTGEDTTSDTESAEEESIDFTGQEDYKGNESFYDSISDKMGELNISNEQAHGMLNLFNDIVGNDSVNVEEEVATMSQDEIKNISNIRNRASSVLSEDEMGELYGMVRTAKDFRVLSKLMGSNHSKQLGTDDYETVRVGMNVDDFINQWEETYKLDSKNMKVEQGKLKKTALASGNETLKEFFFMD